MAAQLGWEILHPLLEGTYLSRQAKRITRNYALVSIALILCVVAYFVANQRYFLNFVSKPVEMSAEDLARIDNPDQLDRYFVHVQGEKSFPSGIQSVEQEVDQNSNKVVSETVKAEYLILVMSKRLLVVRSKPKTGATDFEGSLVQLPSDVRSEIISGIPDEDKDVVPAILPIMIDATGFRADGYWALAICIPVLVFAGWIARRTYGWTQNPSGHPVWKLAASFGDLRDLGAQIDTDIREGAERIGDVDFTRSWIVKEDTFSISVARIADVVWAYKKVTKHSVNFIPTGKTYAAVLFNRNGTYITVNGNERIVDGVLLRTVERTPWVALGYTKELNAAIRGNWAAFIAEVDSRRVSMAQGANA